MFDKFKQWIEMQKRYYKLKMKKEKMKFQHRFDRTVTNIRDSRPDLRRLRKNFELGKLEKERMRKISIPIEIRIKAWTLAAFYTFLLFLPVFFIFENMFYLYTGGSFIFSLMIVLIGWSIMTFQAVFSIFRLKLLKRYCWDDEALATINERAIYTVTLLNWKLGLIVSIGVLAVILPTGIAW